MAQDLGVCYRPTGSGTNRTLEIGVLRDNKSTRTHNEHLRQKTTSRTWLKTKIDCPEKLWSLHPWRSQSTTNPKETDPASSRGLGPASLQSSCANSTILCFQHYLQTVFDAVSHFTANTNPLLDCVKSKWIHSPKDSSNVHNWSFAHISSRRRKFAGTEETITISETCMRNIYIYLTSKESNNLIFTFEPSSLDLNWKLQVGLDTQGEIVWILGINTAELQTFCKKCRTCNKTGPETSLNSWSRRREEK